MARILKKGVKLLVDTLIYIVFALLILIIIGKMSMMVNNKDYFEVFGYSIFNVATGSMEPTIKQNDIIIIKKTKDVKKDDIITFYKDESYITHRVISVDGSTLVTKGDANNTNDFAIGKDVVIGKVIKIITNAGMWQKILTTPTIILSIFLTLICFDFAFSYKGFKPKKETINVKEVKNGKDEEISEDVVKKIGKKISHNKFDNDYTIGLNLEDIQKEIIEKSKKGE